MARRSAIEEQYVGTEPTITADSTNLELVRAYNYFQYYYNAEDAKSFVISFLKSRKVSKSIIKKVQLIPAIALVNIGWNCRLMQHGSVLPEEIRASTMGKLDKLVKAVVEKKDEEEPKVVISIQERVDNKASALIGELEEHVDAFLNGGDSEIDVVGWFTSNNIKPAIAKRIAEFYQPLYEEVYDATQSKDADLKYAYRRWKKPALKKYLTFIKSILSAAEVASAATKGTRKQRKKKVKPAAVLVSKMKFQEKDDEYKLQSIRPADIIGSQQLWVFNTKTRALSVYNAMGPAGLTVKGTTLVGFDEKTSITKKLRKPEVTIKKLMDGGKIVLRNLMSELKTAEKQANGRINTTTILLRTTR